MPLEIPVPTRLTPLGPLPLGGKTPFEDIPVPAVIVALGKPLEAVLPIDEGL